MAYIYFYVLTPLDLGCRDSKLNATGITTPIRQYLLASIALGSNLFIYLIDANMAEN